MYHAYHPTDAAAGPDETLWNATITAGENFDGGAVGWNPDPSDPYGSIDYHMPGSNTFDFNNQEYSVLYAETLSETSAYGVGISPSIQQSSLGAVYAVMGDMRCSLASADANSTYSWSYFGLHDYDPFSDGTDTDVAVLYNENYLTLNGDNPATVPRGANYADAGATTPDGATVTSNASSLDTSMPGTHKIHYNATKRCGNMPMLDTAVRTVEVQGTPPAFASASLDYRTRELFIIFDQKIDVSATDLTKMHISDAGQRNEVSLDGADFDSTASDSAAIYMVLDAGQLSRIMQMSTPQLDIEAGAVSNPYGNAIGDAPDGHIQTFDAGDDRTLWNATITSESWAGSRIGWTHSRGSIDHHPPTENNAFFFDNQTYAIKSLTDWTPSAFYLLDMDQPIPSSDRSSVHIAMDDMRCSFSSRIEGGDHIWYYPTPLASRPLSDGADTAIAILYNPNYLTLNGDDAVTVQQGSVYEDAGASTPDGATIADNAGIVNTTALGTYKIKYTAAKGCGVLDTVFRTVNVTNTPPAFASASLDYRTGEMMIIFDQKIDLSDTDLTKMHVSDAGRNNEVSLDGAAFDNSTSDSNTIYLMLDAGQLSRIMQMSTPQLDIEAGAVSDLDGNAIADAPDGQIQVFTAGDDRTIWDATITSGFHSSDRVTGWVPSYPIGSIAHNLPTTGNTFYFNGTAYTANALYYASGPVEIGFSLGGQFIPDEERDSLHLVMGDKRCSFANSYPGGGNTPNHFWPESIHGGNPNDPFSRGANTNVAVLYNANYLTLNGDNPATVQQGSQYADAGAATPDGADISSNATDLGTSSPGTYKIQYNATKGCGLLGTAVRTVVVADSTPPAFVAAALDQDTGKLTITFDKTIDVDAADLTMMHVSDAGRSSQVSLNGAGFNRTAPDSDTISMTLTASQLSRIARMSTPQLDIAAGAVQDPFGNSIDDAPDNHILIFRAGYDTVLWNATITAEHNSNDKFTGWNSGLGRGSIAYNAPTLDRTFHLNGTAYTVRSLYYADETLARI